MSETMSSGSVPTSTESSIARRLLGIADAGVVLYMFLDIIAQALPPHYNPINSAESDLAVGPYG